VTVCIAAFAKHDTTIAITADSKVAFGDFSTDQGALKYKLLGNRYLALIAGNDVVFAPPTVNRIQTELFKANTRDADETAGIVHEQLCETRSRIIETKVLKRYKLTVEQFVAKGKQSFTEQAYYDICNRIEQQNLSLQFLVAGFDDMAKPHLQTLAGDSGGDDSGGDDSGGDDSGGDRRNVPRQADSVKDRFHFASS